MPTRGAINLDFSSRSFDAPLFEDESTDSNFRLFGSQTLRNGALLSIWGYDEIPSENGIYGAEADQLPLLGGVARASIGDFAPSRLDPPEILPGTGNVFPLIGGAFELTRRQTSLLAYVGESKDRIVIEGRDPARPVLAGVDFLSRIDRMQIGAGVVAIDDPAYFDPEIEEDTDAVGRASLYRVLTPWSSVFAEGFGTINGGLGYRAGAAFRSLNGNVNTAVYSFDGDFPIAPAVRPGETGFEVSGLYRPSELSTIIGNVYWISEDVVTERDNLRGHIGFGKSFGTNAPHIQFSYSHDELTFRTLEEDTTRVADLFSGSISRASMFQYADLRVEHVMHQDETDPDRSQALASFYRYFTSSAFLSANALVQHEEVGDTGITTEATFEGPWRGPWFYLVGIGGAYVERGTTETGEGVARLGVSRRILENGLYGRFEVRVPFDIGLPDSNLNRETYAFHIGMRYGWRDLAEIESITAPIFRPSDFGALEGSVLFDGKGLAAVPILINGRRAAVTGSDCRFRIGRAPVGSVAVGIDLGALEPGYAPVGDATQEVIIAPRQTARAEFEVAFLRSFRGSVVYCENGRQRPLGGAKITLVSGATKIVLETTPAGGFQADDIPPGTYELTIDPASVAGVVASEELPRTTLDLSEDILAYVIRLRCNP